MSRKSWMVLGLVAVLVAGGAWYFLSASGDSATAADRADGNGITSHDMTMGNPNAKVVFIEYAAPMCPHCAHFNNDILPEIKKTYIDTGKVFYVFRVFPIGAPDGVAEKLANISKDTVREMTMTSPMPSYRDKLTTQELADVISYLMSLKGQ